MADGLPQIEGELPPPWFEVVESRVGHRLVLAATGEVDIASADTLREALDDATASGAAEIWLDLTNVEFMDSTGITAIVDALGRLGRRRFAVICPQGPVRRVFEIAGVDRVIAIHPNRFAAHSAR
jgi:anti-sigma B factor antagonist